MREINFNAPKSLCAHIIIRACMYVTVGSIVTRCTLAGVCIGASVDACGTIKTRRYVTAHVHVVHTVEALVACLA